MDLLAQASIRLYENYQEWISFADKRVEDWPLMRSPLPTLGWVVAYLTVVLIGVQGWISFPRYRFRLVVILHNLMMILLNGYIAVYLLILSFRLNYNYVCQPVNYSSDEGEVEVAKVLWWFYFSKLLEFFDTFLFILRGNLRQVTFLHVYHHVSMFSLWWIGIKWVAGGSAFLGAMINSAVHVVMYGYYLAATLFPGKRPWWKKLVTCLQLSQFFLAITQTTYGLYIDCPFPRWMGYTLIGYATSLTLLFANFWIRSYADPKVGPAPYGGRQPRKQERYHVVTARGDGPSEKMD